MSRSTADSKTKSITDIKNIPARRLYRGVLEYARRLENGTLHRRNLMSVFQSEQVGLRHKLRDACEKLMFTHPLEYGKKAEELIWRKVYYEVIQLVKSNKKFMKSGSMLEILYKEYLLAAAGYYHHLLLKLQSKYQPPVDADWSFVSSPLSDKYKRKNEITLTENEDTGKSKEPKDESGIKIEKSKSKPGILNKKVKETENITIEEWARDTCYRLLLCLGDIGRYLVDHGGSRSFAERSYQLSLLVKPNIGMPLNQLGTLAGHHTWWGLTAAYYYYRCLEAEQKFDGADGNLQKLLDRNKKSFYQIPTDALENMISAEEYKKEHTRIFVISFLYLCDLLRPKTYATDVEITGLCKKLIDALPVCLSHTSKQREVEYNADRSNGTSYLRENKRLTRWDSTGHRHHHHSGEDFTFIQPHVILKMCVLCIINIHNLQSSRSNRSSAAIAFALAFFSHLLGHVINRLNPEKCDNDQTEVMQNDVNEDLEEVDLAKEKSYVENGEGDASHSQSKIRMQSKRKKNRMRRRRHRGSGDSDLSEGELMTGSDMSDSDGDSDDSESSATTSTNSELSQEGMDEIVLSNSKGGSTLKSKSEKTAAEQPQKSADIIDNRAGLELANSLANGQSTLASLKDISQKMFQPTVRRRILLAPSFFNNIKKPNPPTVVTNGVKPETVKKNDPMKESDKIATEKKTENKENEKDTAVNNTTTDSGVKCDKKADGVSIDESADNIADAGDKDNSKQNGEDLNNSKTFSAVDIFELVGTLHQSFGSLKILCDWLDANEKVTAACAQNSKALWSRIARLTSLLPNEDDLEMMDEVSSDDMLQSQLKIYRASTISSKKWKQKARLSEDFILSRSTGSVKYADEKENKIKSFVCELSETQQSAIRICRIRSFCHSLCKVDGLEMKYDDFTKKFEGPDEPLEKEAEHLDIETMEKMRKNRLMKDMAELRLRNEVNDLESQLGTPRSRDASLCLYIVPDALALCHDLIHIRRLLSSEKYFIVIPKTVIDGLDGLKKDLQGARDAIRFLETEFKKGNRFIKSQMAEESCRGVQGERPKLRRNDMQAWRFYRIIECCRYISQQKSEEAPDSENSGESSGLVAILTHSTDKSTLSQNQINAISAAEGFGIQVFSASQFSKLLKKIPAETT